MKIAQVLLRYDAPGGVETFVRETSARLRTPSNEVRVFASDLYDEGNWTLHDHPARTVDGISVERFHVTREILPGITMPILPGLSAGLARWRPDVIHAHSHRYGHLLQSSLAAGIISAPLVVSTHFHPAAEDEGTFKKTMLRGQDHLFGLTVYSRADAVIVETENEKRQVGEFVARRKIRIVPPGISWERWKELPTPEAARLRLGLPSRYILFAGRLAPNKGLPDLLEAWSGLGPGERLPLVLVGKDWGVQGELEARARELGVEKEIRFLGNLASLDEYVAAFAGASLFVLPSQYEAFGLVLLEAMAASLPIVATRVGGIPEAVREDETARLVPYANVWELRRAIREFVQDPELAVRIGRAGRRHVEDHFSWERTAAALLSIYEEIA